MASKGIVSDYYKKEKDSSATDSVKEALEKTGGGLESVREALKQTSHQKKSEVTEKTDCEKQLEEKDKKIEELTDTLKRLQAEFENYKKWNAKEKTEFVKYANADLIEKCFLCLTALRLH